MVKRVRQGDVQVTVADAGVKATSAKKSLNWQYVGGKIIRAPGKKLGLSGIEYVDPREPTLPRRKIESNFFLTINTNLSPPDEHEETCVHALRETIKELRHTQNLCQILKFGPVDAAYAEDKYADVIDKVDWKGEVEFGPTLHRLHAHIWVTFTHYSQIQVNSNMLQWISRRLYNSKLPANLQKKDSGCSITRLPYVHVKLLPQSDWATIMRQYIHKAMTD
tara:strand:+ start:107 stop:769 length:663 start_codon:yes stop_codon:yes gene_type:complete